MLQFYSYTNGNERNLFTERVMISQKPQKTATITHELLYNS